MVMWVMGCTVIGVIWVVEGGKVKRFTLGIPAVTFGVAFYELWEMMSVEDGVAYGGFVGCVSIWYLNNTSRASK